MFKDLITKLNKVLNFSTQFKSEKLKDSDATIEYAELVVGADVYTSSSAGSVPAADGKYTTDSGASFEVKEGKISEILETPAEEVVVEEALAVEEDAPVAEEKPADKEAELLKEIEDLKEEIKKLKGDFSALPTKEDLAKFQSELKEEFKKLENIPTEFSKTDTRVELEDTVEDKFKALARAFKAR